jgi:predicted AlkP superfamily pyrophosphatase or phosphodiesterase
MAAERPRLVVVVSVDQLSAELMARWGKDLPGGLGQLYRKGTTFVEAYHDHGFTETGPGHSVLLTGRSPMHTGIVENNWLDRSTGKVVYCVEDPKAAILGASAGTPGVSPAKLQGETLGAWLQDQIPGSRVFAVTGKDRSAILMAGKRAQGVYWFTGSHGFSTSTAYTQSLPPWLQAYNASFLGRLERESLFWSPLDPNGLPPGGTYQIQGKAQTMGLPRTILGVGMPRDLAFWDRFRGSPFLDEAIFGAAEALAAGEHLGHGHGVDLLALGLSATDYVGHGFGNGGPEMLDNLRRLDRELGQYLDRLRAKVPGLWVVLTADHGGGDFPERLQAQGLPAKRLMGADWQRAFNDALSKRLGAAGDFFLPAPTWHQLYLNLETLRQSGKSRAEVLRAAVAVAKATPEVAEACSAEDLDSLVLDPAEGPDHRSYLAKLRLSFQRERSGDLFLAFQPLVMLDDPGHVCCHGHPQDYDRRVPLIFQGPWRAETRNEPVRTVDLAPTLARELGLKPQEALDGRALPLRPKR